LALVDLDKGARADCARAPASVVGNAKLASDSSRSNVSIL